MRRLFAPLSCAVLLIACGSRGGSEPTPTPAPVTVATAGDGDGLVGDWRAYPVPASDEWTVEPLDDARWVRASAELACIGRAHHGDEAQHRSALRQVLSHHLTTASAVMAYGVAVNGDEGRAFALGKTVADAAQSCR